MDEIEAFFSVDIPGTIMSVFIILFGVLAIIKLIEEISKRLGKPVRWIRQTQNDRELLQKTAESLQLLTDRHTADMHDEADRDELMETQLSRFVEEIKDSMQQFTENRIHDREQSLEIQKQLSDEIKKIAEGGEIRNQQIQNLTQGMMELLGDKIDDRFSRYLALSGIPENEVDEFSGLYHAYAANGGNSTRKEKFDYVISHMKIIPVETTLLQDDVDKTEE